MLEWEAMNAALDAVIKESQARITKPVEA